VYGHKVNQLGRRFSKTLNERLTPLGLFTAQWAVVVRLLEGPATQTELCQYLCVEAPTMTRTLARMEQAGWIERCGQTGAAGGTYGEGPSDGGRVDARIRLRRSESRAGNFRRRAGCVF